MNVSESPMVQFNAVSKVYKATPAITDVSFAFGSSKVIGLIGPNGAGKSTILKLICGLLRPSCGTVWVSGKDPYAERQLVRPIIGYVPETHQIYRWMRVCEVVKFASSMYGSWDDSLAKRFLELFKLPVSQPVSSLSRGMIAKLALLIAVCHRPKVLLLDEPISGLDPIARDEFIDAAIRTPVCADQLILFSSHQLDELESLAQEVAVVNEGRILCHGALDDVLSRSACIEVDSICGSDSTERLPNCHITTTSKGVAKIALVESSMGELESVKAHFKNRVLAVRTCTLDEFYKAAVKLSSMRQRQ